MAKHKQERVRVQHKQLGRKFRPLTVSIQPALLQQIEAIAVEHELSRPEVVRRALAVTIQNFNVELVG